MQTQHQGHSPGALAFSVDHEASLAEHQTEEKVGLSSSAVAAATARGRRNSNAIGMIPEGLEIGKKRNHNGGKRGDGSFMASMVNKFVKGNDVEGSQSSSAVTPQAGGSPRSGGGGSPKRIMKAKTSMEIMAEQMEGGTKEKVRIDKK